MSSCLKQNIHVQIIHQSQMFHLSQTFVGRMHSHSQIQRPSLAKTCYSCMSKQFIKAKCSIYRKLLLDACTAIHKFKDHRWPKLVTAACPNNSSKPNVPFIANFCRMHAQPFTNSKTVVS